MVSAGPGEAVSFHHGDNYIPMIHILSRERMRLGTGGPPDKTETRRPKPEGNPRPETRSGAARACSGKIHRLALRSEVQSTGKSLSLLKTLPSRPNPEP